MPSQTSKGRDSPLKTLVSGSLMSPVDSALAAKSFDYTLPRAPPFAIETEQRYVMKRRKRGRHASSPRGAATRERKALPCAPCATSLVLGNRVVRMHVAQRQTAESTAVCLYVLNQS